MKTLSYYQKLREDYACIIPKTAPAYELIEALEALIVSLQPEPTFTDVPVDLPKGWAITINHSDNTISLTDSRGVRRAYVYRNLKGAYAIWWDSKCKTTLKTQKEAIQWLRDKAIDTTQEYSIFNYHGQQLRIPEGWYMARDDDDDYILLDAAGVAFGKVSMTREGDSWAYVDTAPGGAQYSSTLLGALNGLIARAWSYHDAP